MTHAVPCPCGSDTCKTWYVSPNEMTEEQARAVADLLTGTRSVMQPPTAPGWYFARVLGESTRIEPVWVERDGALCVSEAGIRHTYPLTRYVWFGPVHVPVQRT